MAIKVERRLQRQSLERAGELEQKYRYPLAVAYRAALKEFLNSGDVITVNGELRFMRTSRCDGRATV